MSQVDRDFAVAFGFALLGLALAEVGYGPAALLSDVGALAFFALAILGIFRR